MQNVNEDTQWNDALRKHGIIPARAEFTEDQITNLVDAEAQKRLEPKERDLGQLDLDELELLEDDEDERVLQAYKERRIAEMRQLAEKSKFGDVTEISADTWVEQVNRAGEGVTVVVLLYKRGMHLCDLLSDHFLALARKFKAVKFVKGAAQICMPNFPEAHLPCVMIYRDGKATKKFVGPDIWGSLSRLSLNVIEWILAKKGKAFETELEADPRPKTADVMMRQLNIADDSDNEDDDD